MLFTGYIRSYTYNMPIADNWAVESINNGLRSQIQSQVQAQYPNLHVEQLSTEVNLRMNEFLEENKESMMLEKRKLLNL